MKKIVFLFLIISTVFFKDAVGLDAKATIGTVISCNNSEVLVSLNVENFISIGAMTLYIGYDTTQLSFQGLININSGFAGIIYNAMTVPATQIGISYTNMTGATLLAGKLFDMKFNFKVNNTALVFNPGCEVVNNNFENIPVIYINGGVNPLIQIISQPQNIAVYQPGQATFTVTSSGGSQFQWQLSSNGGSSFSNLSNSAVYRGVNTDSLTILSTNTFLNGKVYRCVISNGSCIKISNHALLTVLSYSTQALQFNSGWNSLSAYLNPANPDLDILFASMGESLQILVSDDKIYYPAGNINTIGLFDPTKGYAIKLTRNESFIISGTPLQSNTLLLPAGWSYLPVIVDCDVSIISLFSTLISEVEIVQEMNGVNLYWPEKEIFTLLTLNPGKSYKVNMKSGVMIAFPSCNHFE